MNVAHVFPYPLRISGGHSNAIRSFIECQRAQGINAVGIAPEPSPVIPAVPVGFPLWEVASLWSLRWETIAKRFAFESGSSVLHFHNVDRKFAPLLTDLRQTKVPYAFTSHGQLDFQNPGRWLLKFGYLNFLDRGVRKASGLHLLTGLANRRLKFLVPGYGGRKLVQGHLVTVPNPSGVPAASRSVYGIPSNAFVLVFLGRLDVSTKGLDVLIEAFASLPTSRFRLLLIGPDWNGGQAELERRADQLDCRDRIHFSGPVYGDSKHALLRMADAFVSPSRHEAFGIALVEAMLCGLPIVTSCQINLGPDLEAAQAALVMPLSATRIADAVSTLEADPERRQALASRGKTWAEHNCDPVRAGSRFRNFYQAILEKEPSPGRPFPPAVASNF